MTAPSDPPRPPDPLDPDRAFVQREVVIAAPPEEVWEALTTEPGRQRWLEDDPDREIEIELVRAPARLAWWWRSGDGEATRVEFHVIAVPAGTRVIVTETAPAFPLAAFATSFALVAA